MGFYRSGKFTVFLDLETNLPDPQHRTARYKNKRETSVLNLIKKERRPQLRGVIRAVAIRVVKGSQIHPPGAQ